MHCFYGNVRGRPTDWFYASTRTGTVNVLPHREKKCVCIYTPINPTFYIKKLGSAGVYLFFLFLLQSIDCGYTFESPREAVLTSTHNLCFEQKY